MIILNDDAAFTAIKAADALIMSGVLNEQQQSALKRAVVNSIRSNGYTPKNPNRRKESHASKQRTDKARARQAGSERR
jgi:hypothetical protein